MTDPNCRKEKTTAETSLPAEDPGSTAGTAYSVMLCVKNSTNGCAKTDSRVQLQAFRTFVIDSNRYRYIRGIPDSGSQIIHHRDFAQLAEFPAAISEAHEAAVHHAQNAANGIVPISADI